MRTRRLPFQLGARLAIGLLAAVWLWNLKIVSNNLHLQEGAWPLFPAVSNVTSLQHEAADEIQLKRYSDDDIHNEEFLRKKPVVRYTNDDSRTIARNSTLPPPEHRVPGLIILGAQKSATQALRSYLSQHPQIHFSKSVVEAHFFDWGYDKSKSPEENLEAYIKLLNGKHGYDCRVNDCIAGESTPSYLFATKRVPLRVKQVCPWAKFIVVLRDPVKRAFSQCNMLIEKHEVKTSFREHFQFDRNWMKEVGLATDKAITREEEDEAWNKYQKHRRARKMMLARGLYEIQLRKWFEYFPKEQFLILKSEELEFSRTATMSRVFEFLGLHDQPLEKDKKVHAKEYTAIMSNKTRQELYDFYRPYNQRLEGLLGPEWRGIWDEPS